MFKHLVAGDGESAEATKAFYEEYRSVSDLNAAYYLQTIEQVFQKHALPKGEFVHRGQRIDLGAIKDTALLAIEGERDDISGIGQTRAALHLGSKWRDAIAPVVEQWIARHDGARLKAAA
jgi:poly(3-hydroxybutyrate) depolymerase